MTLVNRRLSEAFAATLIFAVLSSVHLQAQAGTNPTNSGSNGSEGSAKSADSGQGTSGASQDEDLKKTLKDIQDYLKAQQPDETEFGLLLGIGSLLTAPGVTDYQNQSNVLNVAHLGKATPQLLTGVSFRTKVPSLFLRFGCPGKHKVTSQAATPSTATSNDTTQAGCSGEIWQRNPWSAFASLTFAPGASNPINGYVLGGSFALAHHLAFIAGFALTPVSEPSPGFRTVAAQFVQVEQQSGLYKNFDPSAMLKNGQNAFDGFPLTNPSTGALIYPGNALATHYRGGVVLGISMPIAFSSFLKSGGAPPASSTSGK